MRKLMYTNGNELGSDKLTVGVLSPSGDSTSSGGILEGPPLLPLVQFTSDETQRLKKQLNCPLIAKVVTLSCVISIRTHSKTVRLRLNATQ